MIHDHKVAANLVAFYNNSDAANCTTQSTITAQGMLALPPDHSQATDEQTRMTDKQHAVQQTFKILELLAVNNVCSLNFG